MNLILNKLKYLEVDKHSLESWDHIVEVVRVLLTKTLINNEDSGKEDGIKLYGDGIEEDLEFMYILKNHKDLKIVD